MQGPLTTLLDKPWEPTSASNRTPIFGSWKKREVGIIFLPIYLPFLIIAALISIPWGYVREFIVRRNERKFASHMASAGRAINWDELQNAIETGQGTLIAETSSFKGPWRLWWTPADVRMVSPHKCDAGPGFEWLKPEFQPFWRWCYEQFTNPESGTARLVSVPDDELKRLYEKLPTLRAVSIFSATIREQRARKK